MYLSKFHIKLFFRFYENHVCLIAPNFEENSISSLPWIWLSLKYVEKVNLFCKRRKMLSAHNSKLCSGKVWMDCKLKYIFFRRELKIVVARNFQKTCPFRYLVDNSILFSDNIDLKMPILKIGLCSPTLDKGHFWNIVSLFLMKARLWPRHLDHQVVRQK